ncbi:MAG: polysaccharide deacetylase family protein [Candidatus Omnitrophota bacterium]
MMKRKLSLSIAVIFFAAAAVYGWLYANYSVPIFMYHSFDKNQVGEYAAVSLDTFRRQMDFIKQGGYNVMALEEYCRFLREKKSLPRNTVILTADDGYKNNLAAVKVLKQRDFAATIFIIANKIGDNNYLSQDDIDWFLDQTRVDIGSHTLDHLYLPVLNNGAVKRQIKDSKGFLERMFNREINTIAYPLGGFDERVLEEVKKSGYLCACATNRGFSKKLERFALRRIKVNERDLGVRLWAKLSGFYNVFRRVRNPY